MTNPEHDEGRPGEGNGLDVDTTINNDIIAQQLRRRAEEARRCVPLPDGRRDVLEKTDDDFPMTPDKCWRWTA